MMIWIDSINVSKIIYTCVPNEELVLIWLGTSYDLAWVYECIRNYVCVYEGENTYVAMVSIGLEIVNESMAMISLCISML